MEWALYNGIIQKAESREENGYCLLRLELCGGSILLDLNSICPKGAPEGFYGTK